MGINLGAILGPFVAGALGENVSWGYGYLAASIGMIVGVLWLKMRESTLEQKVKLLETNIEAIKTSKIYDNAFEWRFEFPEVLDDNGNFIGFDIVIGNPPYFSISVRIFRFSSSLPRS